MAHIKTNSEELKKIQHEQVQENKCDSCKNKKTTLGRKLKALATKTKSFLKNHFPKRFWSNKQDSKKGQKF